MSHQVVCLGRVFNTQRQFHGLEGLAAHHLNPNELLAWRVAVLVGLALPLRSWCYTVAL